jgi:hypothetical protein
VQELVRPETRVESRSQSERFPWGIVDVILAVIMLPFGVWFLLIEGMVDGLTASLDRS